VDPNISSRAAFQGVIVTITGEEEHKVTDNEATPYNEFEEYSLPFYFSFPFILFSVKVFLLLA
jgi:hypothetical protein